MTDDAPTLGNNYTFVERMLLALHELTGDAGEDGVSFKNDVFEMHTWVMDAECGCAIARKQRGKLRPKVHSSDCQMRPNFRCGDIEITWYRHIGRSLEVNREVSRATLEEMFKKCLRSVV